MAPPIIVGAWSMAFLLRQHVEYSDRNLPPSILRFLMFWYEHQSMCVGWNGVFSDTFRVSNGVRQGGVLSPVLFSVYMDELIVA